MQRLRDQIKTWQGDSSIKDKSKLYSNRKLIEAKMEKFKICEKETKTKAFSKEGLMQDRTDPKQKQKAEIIEWVGDAIRKIQEQNEEMESEIESMTSGRRRKRGTNEDPKVTELKGFITRNEKHIGMLERVLRALDNDAITPEEVIELKDSVEYYVESNQDPDFYEDEEMYAELNLDSVPTPAVNVNINSRKSRDDDAADNNTSSNNNHNKASTPTGDEKSSSRTKKSVLSPKSNSASKARGTKRTNMNTSAIPMSISIGAGSSPANKKLQSPILNGHHHHNINMSTTSQPVQSPRVRPGGPLMSSVVKSGSAAAAAAVGSKEPVVRQIYNQKNKNQAAIPASSSFAEPIPMAKPTVNNTTQMRWNGVVARNHNVASPSRPAHMNSNSNSNMDGNSNINSNVTADRRNTHIAGATSSTGTADILGAQQAQQQQSLPSAATTTASAGCYEPTADELEMQTKALQGAAKCLPEDWFGHASFDGASIAQEHGNAFPQAEMGTHRVAPKSRLNTAPRNPVNVPASFPHIPSSVFDKANIFLKFDPDTLFFIFYYQQGTLQQYLAAKELKRQGWRFHKKYLTWFQRHDEPKVVNDEAETGTFIYFDYANVVFRGQGSGWCQRIKSEFVFEYRYLEADDDE